MIVEIMALIMFIMSKRMIMTMFRMRKMLIMTVLRETGTRYDMTMINIQN